MTVTVVNMLHVCNKSGSGSSVSKHDLVKHTASAARKRKKGGIRLLTGCRTPQMKPPIIPQPDFNQ